MQRHTRRSSLVSQTGTAADRKDLRGSPVLPAVGWLEGLAVFVKVMGSRWANSQGTRSTLCHLRTTTLGKGGCRWGLGLATGVGFQLSPKPPSALLRLLQLHLKVITRPAVSKQGPYGVSIVEPRLGALLHSFGEERAWANTANEVLTSGPGLARAR